MMDINEVLTSVVYEFFVKETASLADKSVKATGVNNKIIQSEQLAEELYKPIIRTFRKERYIHHLKIIFGVLILLTCQ